MSDTVEQLKSQFEAFLAEDAKFTAGNGAAGTRARKALQEVAKLVKARSERKEAVEQIPGIIADCKEKNVSVVTMSAVETEKFKTLTAPLYDKYKNFFSTDLIAKIQKA